MKVVWLPAGARSHGGEVDVYASASSLQLAEAILKQGGFNCAADELTLFAAERDGKWLPRTHETSVLKQTDLDQWLIAENLMSPKQSAATALADAPPRDVVHVLVVVPSVQERQHKKQKLNQLLPPPATPSLFAGLKYRDSWTQVLKKNSGQIECHRAFRNNQDNNNGDENDGGLAVMAKDTEREPSLPPIVLLHEAFARFQDNCQRICITKHDCAFVTQICEATAKPWNNKYEYMENVQCLLGIYLDVGFNSVVLPDAPSDCEGVFALREQGIVVVNLVCRAQRCSGNGDPVMENVAHYLKHLPKTVTNQYPCLLLDICGPMLSVSGIVNVSDKRAVCEPLAPALPMMFFENEWLLTGLARTFAALKVAIQELRQWAESSKQQATEFHPGYALFRGIPPRPRFPYKDTIRSEGGGDGKDGEITLTYKRVITSTVFEAWHPQLQSDVVVKFASQRYGTHVHKFCHSHQFAPALLYEEPLPGGWIFVVMEKVSDLQPLANAADQQLLRNQLAELQHLLQKDGSVHGDLRQENVLWDAARQSVVVLDFGWAGMDGEATYPLFMNTTDIDWPEGAEPGKPMRATHDAEWLRRLLE